MCALAVPSGDDATLSAIRSVLTEPVEAAAPVPKMERVSRLRSKADPVAKPVDESPNDIAADVEPKPSMMERLRGISYRPSRKLVIWAVIVSLIVLRPHVFVIGTIVLLVSLGAAFAIFGSEAVWSGVMRLFARYATYAPNRAARFATRMDTFALRWDALLDRFPDGAVDGLYLPDFQSLHKADERHAAVMSERLARL